MSMNITRSRTCRPRNQKSPARKAAEFFNREDSHRIPWTAYIGAALFVAVMYGLMFVGALAGF